MDSSVTPHRYHVRRDESANTPNNTPLTSIIPPLRKPNSQLRLSQRVGLSITRYRSATTLVSWDFTAAPWLITPVRLATIYVNNTDASKPLVLIWCGDLLE